MADEPEVLESGTDIFGLPTTDPEEDPRFAEPAPEVVAEPVADAPDPALVVEETQLIDPAAPSEPEGTKEPLLAGKYKNSEALEKGYRELRDLQRRTAERANAWEKQAGSLQNQSQQLQRVMQEVGMRQQLQQQQLAQINTQRAADPYAEPTPQPQITPEIVRQLVDREVAAKTGQMQQRIAHQLGTQKAVAEAEQNVMGFYEAHPEVEIRGETDVEITNTLLRLNENWAKMGEAAIDISSPDSLEIVYEATKNPELFKVLSINPRYFDDDAGMELARFQASMLKGQTTITQQTQQVPASQVGKQRKPVTERASTGGAPPPATDPNDPWQSAVSAYRSDRSKTADSIFFE